MKRVLELPSLVLFGLAFMSPLAVFVTYGAVQQVTHTHISSAYIITLIAIIFTAISYGRMSRVVPNSGSAYAYATKSFGTQLGFLVGWALLLDYLLAPMLCYLVLSIYMHDYFPEIAKNYWIFAAAIVMFVLNVLGIKLVSKINLALVACQLLFVAAFLVLSIIVLMHTKAEIDFLQPFYDPKVKLSMLISGSAILCLSFLGFESISTLSEEAEKPESTIPKAIILCVLLSGALYTLTAYMGQLVVPHWPQNTDPDTMGLKLISFVGGENFKASFVGMSLIGCLATAMAAIASVSRVLYSMGGNGAIPTIFGRLHKKYETPVVAIAIVSIISLLSMFMSLTLASNMISFGALVAFTFVNLAVFKYFFIDQMNRNLVSNLLLPLIGFGLTIWLWTSLSSTAIIVGASWLAVGLVYLMLKPQQLKMEI
ncbi:APC family permease [Parashewanella curva]|uniref:APC family permease n=1 Tax=Parashewanella curva TaxID=2338552 RepID=A0A3L8PZ50_9GAMM|nr:APC family permease [Parashewanella curva]RLV60654.1 APC family permease [Parashewanella curva]